MHQSDDESISAKKRLHARVKNTILDKKNKSPKLFYIGLSAILTILVVFITVFSVTQSNAALAANIYKPKLNEYLDSFYNELSKKSGSYDEKLKNLTNLKLPQQDTVFLGWLNFKYAKSALLESEVSKEIENIISQYRSNADFFNFIDSYSKFKTAAISLGDEYRKSAASQKASLLTLLATKYREMSVDIDSSKLGDELNTTKQNLRNYHSEIADSFMNMSTANQQNNKIAFASASYIYMKNLDLINGEMLKIAGFKTILENKINLSIERFKKFVDEVKK